MYIAGYFYPANLTSLAIVRKAIIIVYITITNIHLMGANSMRNIVLTTPNHCYLIITIKVYNLHKIRMTHRPCVYRHIHV